MKALAEGKIELIDTSGKKKRSKDDKVDPKKLKAGLEWKRNDSVKAGANLIRTIQPMVEKIAAIDPNRLKSFKMNFDGLAAYFNVLQKGSKISHEEKRLRDTYAPKSDPVAKVLMDFTKLYIEVFTRAHEGLVSFKEKIDDIKEKDIELAKASSAVAAEENSAVDSYTNDHTDVIKRDISIINSFVVSAAEKSANRVPFSGRKGAFKFADTGYNKGQRELHMHTRESDRVAEETHRYTYQCLPERRRRQLCNTAHTDRARQELLRFSRGQVHHGHCVGRVRQKRRQLFPFRR